MMKKIFVILFAYFLVADAFAQSFEEKYALQWCKCTEEMFDDYADEDSKYYNKSFQEIGAILDSTKTNPAKDGVLKMDFEKLYNYFQKNKPAEKEYLKAVQELANICMEDAVNEKFAKKATRKQAKSIMKVADLLQKNASYRRGYATFMVWLAILQASK